MAQLDEIIARGVASGAAPSLAAMVGDRSGVRWSGTAGEAAPGRALSLDAVFRIFSMTKAVGSTAAMILIDRGKLDMDAPVASLLPDFEKVRVLDGFDGDEPRLRAPRKSATVRHLATHTSGFVYEFWNPDVPRYLAKTGHPTILSGLKSSLFYPLVFDPGQRWDYGIGIDWLGQVVEAVDGRKVDRFCREEIFEPLGMTSTAFEPDGFEGRLVDAHARTPEGGFAPLQLAPPAHPEFYGMGHALYSTIGDYMRFLRMFLNRGALDGQRVLSEAAVARMLANQIGDLRIGKLVTAAPPVSADFEAFPGTPKTHSFGFMRVEADVPGMRSAGSQGWAGVLNTHYWFDPAKDVAGLIMTQTLPFVEPPFLALYGEFERAVYASL